MVLHVQLARCVGQEAQWAGARGRPYPQPRGWAESAENNQAGLGQTPALKQGRLLPAALPRAAPLRGGLSGKRPSGDGPGPTRSPGILTLAVLAIPAPGRLQGAEAPEALKLRLLVGPRCSSSHQTLGGSFPFLGPRLLHL